MLSVNGNLPFSTVLADGAETTLPASANSDITVQEDIQEVQTAAPAFLRNMAWAASSTTRSAKAVAIASTVRPMSTSRIPR